eukprot:348007_1
MATNSKRFHDCILSLSSLCIIGLIYYHSTFALKSASSNSNIKWKMFPTDNIGFHMKLSLNTLWSFDPINTTTLQIQINSDSIGNQFRELLISFSQSNNIYFSTLIQIDETDDHLIYPKCKTYPTKQQFANGNIYTLLQNNTLTSNRIQTAMNNTFNSYLFPYNPKPNISYPLTFILHNIPSENILLFPYLNQAQQITILRYEYYHFIKLKKEIYE